MIICLDLRFKTESGASSYIKNLVPHLLKQDKENEYIFVKYPDQKFEFELGKRKIILSPSSNAIIQLLWDVTILPLKLRDLGVTLYHPLKNPGLIWGNFKKVFTIHSINVDYKGSFPTSFRRHLYHTIYTNYFTKKCTRLIAVSEFLSNFAAEGLRINKKYIDVIYHGIDPKFKKLNDDQIAHTLKKYNLPKDYILSVGNITPVKNHLTTVKAFGLISESIKEKYVIVGATSDPYCQVVSDFIKKNNLTERVFLPGFIQSDDLPSLMSGAKLLLFPSLTEGCPVTMLEAFACGLPVVASKRGGLWDLGKDCAEFVDNPDDDKTFAEKIVYLLQSTEARSALSQKSLAVAEDFSWENCAHEHLKTYQKCAPCVR
ncbi:glycosyltransferase family 4 protein [candidate division KSB1 bacterium]|nr:glycosyltransferase family 4 protein [candidate division KSB1 bacterium]